MVIGLIDADGEHAVHTLADFLQFGRFQIGQIGGKEGFTARLGQKVDAVLGQVFVKHIDAVAGKGVGEDKFRVAAAHGNHGRQVIFVAVLVDQDQNFF